jgi:hypothetical protein
LSATDFVTAQSVNTVLSVSCQQKEKSESGSPLAAALSDLERHRPEHIKAADWRHAVEDGRRFLVAWGEQAAALGWTATDIFALPPIPENPHPSWQRLARVDLLGLVWSLHGRPVTAVTAEAITIEMPAGNLLRFYRPPDNGDNGAEEGVSTPSTVDTLPAAQAHNSGASPENNAGGDIGDNGSPAQAGKTSLTQHQVNELAHWYFEEGDRCRNGLDLDRDALDRDLRRRLAKHGVPPATIATEFERVMVAVFTPSPWLKSRIDEPAKGAAEDGSTSTPPASRETPHPSPDADAADAVAAYTRRPDGSWSSQLPVRAPQFETTPRADHTTLPSCTGWCSGCAAPSTWRATPPNQWHCIRCATNAACAPGGAIPFMITRDMKQRLRLRGFSDIAIANMRPAEAHDILAGLEP